MKKKKQIRHGILNFFVRILLPLIILSIILINAPAWAQDNKHDLIITRLWDNYSSNMELKTGWGFSCLIQGAEKTILFDIGSGDAIINMDKLKINPASIDVLVISHDHFDHIGGRHAFSEKNRKAKTFFVPHDSVKICENVYTTGEMGTYTKENALIIKTLQGLVVITGCAHPGIVEIVKKAKQLFPQEEVYLVMGGFHLFMNDNKSIREIVSELHKENVRKISPSHCTGDFAESVFKEVFGGNFIPGDVGKPIIIEGAFMAERQ
jgi:7,8-dihydropterin-6-yl-methyl-4-(beta-D-ribofuranosyl)aminobenzene 5'-phosphate synthase